jgi:hypothetical protein
MPCVETRKALFALMDDAKALGTSQLLLALKALRGARD